MAATVEAFDGNRKRKSRAYPTVETYQTLMSVAREPNNPVKLRAQARAKELGKTLGQVYAEAKVNKAYLSEKPKSGWRNNRLQSIARVLGWTVDELTNGTEEERRLRGDPHQDAILLEKAIQASIEVMRLGPAPDAEPPENIGQLGRMLFQLCRQQASSGEEQFSQQSLINIGRLLATRVKISTSS